MALFLFKTFFSVKENKNLKSENQKIKVRKLRPRSKKG